MDCQSYNIISTDRKVLTVLADIHEKSAGEYKGDASSYIRLLEDTQFVVAPVVAQFILAYLGPATKLLQTKYCNLSEARKDIASANICIGNARSQEQWDKLFKRTENLANSIDIHVMKPRTSLRQKHRLNAGVLSSQRLLSLH